MSLKVVIPRETNIVTPEAIVKHLRQAAHQTEPFAPLLIEFCSDLSQALLGLPNIRRYADIVAFAFWLRKSEVHKLKQRFEGSLRDGVVTVPRGLVFHVPPSNVDTIFMYSWILSFLVGNVNVVRLSGSRPPQVDLICDCLQTVLSSDKFKSIADRHFFVSYGHEAGINGVFSREADARCVWGGDKTVSALREFPLPPWGKDIGFADKYSYTMIAAAAYLGLADSERATVAANFYNDAFTFDQMACSSPKMIFWIGSEQEAAGASEVFFKNLSDVAAKKNYQPEPGVAIEKVVHSQRSAIELNAKRFRHFGASVAVMTLDSPSRFRGEHCGGGFFYEVSVQTVQDILPFIEKRDQTLSYLGVPATDLLGFVRAVNGRGIDRVVPIGQALNFSEHWDGMSLFDELTKKISVVS